MTSPSGFAMPKPVRITGRSSSITNSFVNGIIPVIVPTEDEIKETLGVLGMDFPVCSYCGDTSTESDHLRPLVIKQRPTGYISEIHNLVPSCGKCNQSKGNKPWRTWMFSSARLSPLTRGISDIDERASRLEAFERWGSPTQVNFEELVGAELWAEHWMNHQRIIALMREAEQTAAQIRITVASTFRSPTRM
ncbi:HNH endonuclease [Corynebacterium variabile]|uniref:HNH endonuclease signature motif containing protein n=1 Tax=Corynebacterium variabile TaxID=1727 RepID=UPI003A906DCE